MSNGWLLNVSSSSTLKVKNPQLIKLSHEISLVNAPFKWFRVKAPNANFQKKKIHSKGAKIRKYFTAKINEKKIRCLA